MLTQKWFKPLRIREYTDTHGFRFSHEIDSIFDTIDEDGVDISVRTDGVWRILGELEGVIFEIETNPAIHN